MPNAGLDILNMEGHSSGNPVVWDSEAGGEAKEYFSMIHVKKGDYAHWGVRIDKASRRVTHVSAGPVIKARDYRNEVLQSSIASTTAFDMKYNVSGSRALQCMHSIACIAGWAGVRNPRIEWTDT